MHSPPRTHIVAVLLAGVLLLSPACSSRQSPDGLVGTWVTRSDQTEFGMAAETVLVFTNETFTVRTTLADGDSVEAHGEYRIVDGTLVSPDMDKGRPMAFRIEGGRKLVITLADGTICDYARKASSPADER